MKKRLLALVLLIILIFAASGCQYIPFFNKEEELLEEEVVDPNFPVDVRGTTINLKPERVVALSGDIIEKVYDLGLDYALVGAPDYTTYPPAAQELAPCGTWLLPNVEEIARLKTDLLITNMPLSAEDTQLLSENGVVTLEIPSANSLDELWQAYRDIAIAIEGKENGADIGDEFVDELSGWFNKLKEAGNQQEPALVEYLTLLDFNMATGDTLVGELLREVGYKNIAEDYTDWLYPKDEAESPEGREQFKALDHYFFDGQAVSMKMLEKSEFYKGLPATINDRFLIIDYSTFEHQGLRMFKQLLEMLEYSYPEGNFPSWGFGAVDTPASSSGEDSGEELLDENMDEQEQPD